MAHDPSIHLVEDPATGEKVTRSFTADTPGIHEIEGELQRTFGLQ